MTSLKDLIEQQKRESGIGKLIVQYQIRTYTEMASHQTLLDEIAHIDDKNDLRILIGAGMRGQLYYACLAQAARLEGIA